MILKDSLKEILESAGVRTSDLSLWLRTMDALPPDRAEVFVYILGQLNDKDIVFFDKNLRDKAAFARGDGTSFRRILDEEKLYLARD